VTGDAVLNQTEWTFDKIGNAELVTARERFHDETDTGALGAPTTGVNARVSYSASYFDKADRLTASVDVGTNGGSAYTRPGTVPSRSDTVLVTEFGYNAAGLVETTTDPKGLVGKSFYDLMGRTTKTIENYVNGTVSDADDKTVEYTYHPNGQTKTLKALLTGGGYQTTEWVLGITSPIVSNDILKEMRYPDPSSGNASTTEKDAYTYNQLGQVLTFTDRNGNVRTYSYDVLGRITMDAVTTLGSGVDGTVRRIEYAYDTQGNLFKITSYDAVSGGNVVNEVQREFNGLAQLTKEYQAVNGAVNTGSTPFVQYSYSFAASGSTNHSRLTSITYPNGRVITYNYATGLADNISRLSSITDGSTTLESYDYLGYGTVVKRGHAQPGVDLTFIKQSGESDGEAGDNYIGLDRFGRVKEQRWRSASADLDRWQYGYDRNSNRPYKENLVNSGRSELYTYDGLNQLTSFSRGTLNGTKDGISGNPSRTQSWDLDALGNFDSQTTDGTGQTRTHNKQNEITSVQNATTPTYDANGNLTKDEAGRTFKYDGWNRLVEVRDSGSNLLATSRYDGLNRRIQETKSSTTTDLYYSSQWQVLEEREGGNAKKHYAWSPVYVDALIARDRDTDGDGAMDERVYVVQDGNFNVTALLDTSGNVVERFGYDAYGAVVVLTPTWGSRSASSFQWTYLHQGQRHDNVTAIYDNRYRFLNSSLGRWLTLDPIRYLAHDENLYRYVANSPQVRTDPAGLKTQTRLKSVPGKKCTVEWIDREFRPMDIGMLGVLIHDAYRPWPAAPAGGHIYRNASVFQIITHIRFGNRGESDPSCCKVVQTVKGTITVRRGDKIIRQEVLNAIEGEGAGTTTNQWSGIIGAGMIGFGFGAYYDGPGTTFIDGPPQVGDVYIMEHEWTLTVHDRCNLDATVKQMGPTKTRVVMIWPPVWPFMVDYGGMPFKDKETKVR
jgi:RHS repeat-associated protein